MSLLIDEAERFDRTTILLHWVVALLVPGLWLVGQLADSLPKGPIRSIAWSNHVTVGFLLFVVLAVRIIWRLGSGRRLPGIGSRLVQSAARAVHLLLYVLLLTVLVLGIVNAFVRGYSLYGLVKLPQLGDKEWRHAITDWHGFVANLLLGLAVLHASVALAHHYLWKDHVLRRMLFPRASRSL
jgi:cytochrome b561